MGKYLKSDKITKNHELKTGDIVRVHQKIYEDNKTRIQIFEGTVIAIKNTGDSKSITVRKISEDKIAVERIWSVNSPHIEKIEVKKKGNYNKAKLYFLRNKTD